MALGQETRDEIREFFESTAGSIVLDRIKGLRGEHNNLLSVLNGAASSEHPELVVARSGGVVDGVDRVLLLIDDLGWNGE